MHNYVFGFSCEIVIIHNFDGLESKDIHVAIRTIIIIHIIHIKT